MCGAPLSPAPVQAPALQSTRSATPLPMTPQAVPSASHVASAPAQARPSAPAPVDDAPIITGPSFLGLNQPAPNRGRGASLRPAQDHLRSSRNLDYLLEDEDDQEPKRRIGKVLLILIALALALGFGYLHWKQGGFDWLTASARKPSAAQPADSSQPQPSSEPAPAPSSATPSSTPQASPSGSNADSSAANQTSPATSQPANPAPTSPGPRPESGSANAPSANTPAPAAPGESGNTQPKVADSAAAATPQRESTSDTTAKAPDTEAPAPKPARAAKPTPVKPSDPVADAEKYIYGRGVRQDCDRGLRQLKPAAEQSNPKAMISLGALYATGVCTPRDLPTAYRWFAFALRKQPDNEPLQENLQKIWAQMTQPERQLAVKLTQ